MMNDLAVFVSTGHLAGIIEQQYTVCHSVLRCFLFTEFIVVIVIRANHIPHINSAFISMMNSS